MTIAKDSGDQVAAKRAATTRETSPYRLRFSGPAEAEDLTSLPASASDGKRCSGRQR